MKVIVCGPRDAEDEAFVWQMLDALHRALGFTAMMQGGALGIDRLAKRWAALRGIRNHEERADWRQYGNAAGPRRNAKMLAWRPDLVIAFHVNRGTPGTSDMVRQAKAAGVPVHRVGSDEIPVVAYFTGVQV